MTLCGIPSSQQLTSVREHVSACELCSRVACAYECVHWVAICAERTSARESLTKGMNEICGAHMQAMVDQARAFAAVLGKLDMDFVAEEAEDEIVEALETANVERFESELAEELAAFKPTGK